LKEIKKQLKDNPTPFDKESTPSQPNLSPSEVKPQEQIIPKENEKNNNSNNTEAIPQKISIHAPQIPPGKKMKIAKNKPLKRKKNIKNFLPFKEIKEKINGKDVKEMLSKLKPIPKTKLKKSKAANITADIFRHINLDETITLLPHSRGVVGVISNNLKNEIGGRPLTDLIENGELVKIGNQEIKPSEANEIANAAYLPLFWNQLKATINKMYKNDPLH